MTQDLVRRLRATLRGEVDVDARRRAEYSSDASNYRVVPQVVAFPHDRDDVLAALEVARADGTPVTVRGGGTSVAGNAIGPGIVLDLVPAPEPDPRRRPGAAAPPSSSPGSSWRSCRRPRRRTDCGSARTRPPRPAPRSAG